MENSGESAEDLMGFINSDGSHKAGLLEISLKEICNQAAIEAIKRGKYRAAVRLHYLGGDRFSFLDAIDRKKQLVGGAMSKAGLSKSALDVEGLCSQRRLLFGTRGLDVKTFALSAPTCYS